MSFSIGDFFPLKGSRRAAARSRDIAEHGGRRSLNKPGPRRSRFAFEAIEPRLLLSADGVVGNLTPTLLHGLTAVGDEIHQLFDNPAVTDEFDKLVPGIVETLTLGDNRYQVSPTLGEALGIRADVSTANMPAYAGGGSLLARYQAIDALTGSAGDTSDEIALRAMDLDADGDPGFGNVSWDEAFKVLVVGQVQDYLASTTIVDQDADPAIDARDVALQVRSFLLTLDDINAVEDWQLWLSDRVVLDIDGASSSFKNDTLTWTLDFSLSLRQADVFDLGYEAASLGIGIDPGAPPNANTDPYKLPVTRTADFASFSFGVRNVGGGVVDADFFFAAPADGVRIGVNVGTPGTPYTAGLHGLDVNVGFLGAEILSSPGYGVVLDMDVLGGAVDPSSPTALGFSGAQLGALQTGTVEAAGAVDLAQLDTTAIDFTLKLGTDGSGVERIVVLPQGPYANVGEVVTALNAALVTAGLGGLVSASDTDANQQIELTVVGTNPAPLGFGAETGSVAQIAGEPAALVGKTAAQLAANPDASFLLVRTDTVTGVAEARLVQVNVTTFSDDGDDNTAGNADDETTLADVRNALAAAANAAFTAAITAGINGSDLTLSSAGGRLEITRRFTVAALGQITLAELQGAAQIFDMAKDAAAAFDVNLKLKALEGLQDETDADYRPEGTIKVDIDPFSASDVTKVIIDVDPPTGRPIVSAKYELTDAAGLPLTGGGSDLQTLLDFNVIGVADILGIFSQLSNWFDQVSASDLLQGFDIPFADTSLGSLLNFKDLISDALLIDDRDDGPTKQGAANVKDAPKLLEWKGAQGKEQLRSLFGNAQQLAERLDEILPGNLGDIDATVFRDGDDRQNLTYRLSIADVTLDVDVQTDGDQALTVPLDFEIDLGPVANFETSGKLAVSATGSIGMTVGIVLGNAVDVLDGATTDVASLNSDAGVAINTNWALTSLGVIEPLVGRLTASAHFTVLTSNDGTTWTPHEVTLAKSATDNNLSLNDPAAADPSTRLLADLNAALAAAGLAGKIVAESEPIQGATRSARIVLRAVDTSIERFQVVAATNDTAFTELGLRAQSAATVSLIAPEAVPLANPGGDVNLSFEIERTGGPSTVGVTLTGAATADNVSLQSLIDDLSAVLPAGIVASQSGGRLVLSAVEADITAFTVGNAAALGLSLAAANTALQDQGVSAGAVPDKLVAGAQLRGGAAPADPFGRLAAAVAFTINGLNVSIAAAEAAGNTSIDDLVRDLNAAIEANPGLKGQIAAVNDGNRVALRAIDKSVASIAVAGLSADESTALGLANGSSADGLKLRSSSLAPVSYGVSEDTPFVVTINGTPYNASLLSANTIANRSLFDLAASLNGAISLALGGATKNPLLATAQNGQIVIGLKTTSPGSSLIGDPAGTVDGSDGVVTPVEVTGFSINSPHARFADQLKLISAPNTANVADKADLLITFSDNSTPLRVTFDALDTDTDQKVDGKLGALIAAIFSAPGAAGRVSVGFGSGGTSLKLTDNTWVDGGPNPGQFSVSAVNGSPAAAQLGILGSDTASINVNEVAPGAAVADGVIDGGRIATIDLIDRVYLQDVGASAELSVATVGVVSAEASFGFAGIKVESADNQALFSAEADLPLFDAAKTLRAVFDALTSTTGTTLADLVGAPTLTLDGDFSLNVSLLPGFDVAGFTPPAAAELKFLTDTVVLDLATVNAAPAVGQLFPDLGIDIEALGFGDLLKFQDISFDNVLEAVQAIADFLNQFEAFGFLGDEIPLLGVSVNDLLDVADKFQAAVDDFRDNPAGGIQQLAQRIREAFGLPDFANNTEAQAFLENFGIDASALPAGFQMIQFALVGGNILRLDLRLPVGFSQALNVDLDLGSQLFAGGPLPVDIQGGAGLAASGYLDAQLSFGIDLDSPTDLLIYDDKTQVVGHFGAGASNLQFNASIGPMGAFIKDGRVSLALDFDASGDDSDGNPESLSDFLNAVEAGLTGTASATLPVFFPTDSQYLGDIDFAAGFALDTGDGLQVNTTTFDLPDFSAIDLSAIDPFGSIPLMLDTLDFFLMGLQDVLDGEVMGVKLPLIGDQLQGGVGFIEDLRRDLLTPLRQYIEQAPELATDIVQALLFELLGPNSAQGMVDLGGGPQSIESLLGIAGDLDGLNLLQDRTDDANAIIDQDDVQTPTVVDGAEWRFALGGSYPLEVPLNFDLGIDALSFDMNTALIFGLDWTLGIGLGISKQDGAYLYVGDTDELQLTLSIDVANSLLTDLASIRGELGFLQLEVWEDGGNAEGLENDSRGTYLQGSFKIDLKGAGTDTNVSFSELGSLDADVKVSADAEVNLFIKAAFNEDLLPPTISALLPGVTGRFVLDWETPPNILAGNVDFGNSLSLVGFRDVTVDMGSFITDLVQPFVEKIAEVTEPLQPIIEVITTPIPVISDLAGQPISLVDIAGATGYVDPGLIYAVADIITLVNKIGGGGYDAFGLPLGDFMLLDTAADAGGVTLLTGAALTTPGYKLARDSKFDGGDDGGALKAFVNASRGVFGELDLPGFDSLLGSGTGDSGSQDLVKSLNDGNEGGGFEFPIFDHPELLFGLLLGKDIPLITYDLAPFSMDFSYVQKFPVWDALFVRIGGSVGLTIDLAFGYDTAGVREFADGGFSNPLDLLGGLYVSDTNQPTGEGVDVPELILRGELFAGAELNLGVASAGADGVIGLVVNFDLYDPDSDGKVRINELVGNFLYEWNYGSPALAPIAIFDVYGEIYAQLRAFVESVFFKIEFEITPPITLFEFSIPFERQPFLATERGDGSLLLNIGPNASQRLNGDTRDLDETIYVESVSDSEVRVWGMGINASDAQTYTVNKALGIFGYGGQGNDLIDLSLVSHPIRYTLEGGAGDDTILGSAGGGSIRGDAGNDSLSGGAAVDVILGGEGNDTIHGHGDADRLFGDSGSITAIMGAERFRSFVGEKDGDDRIFGDAGNDIIFGGGGIDWIEGGTENDIVIGDGGNFDLVAGALTRLPAVQGSRYDVTARGLGDKDTIFGNAGADALFGGPGDDLIDGGADDDEIEAGDGFDVVYGGSGADTIYGGNQNDIIFGFRDPQGSVFGQAGDVADNVDPDGIDTIYGEEGNDFIRGNGDNDRLYGGRGADVLFGDEDNDELFGEAGGDIMFGGADDDFIDGSDGADIAFGDDGLVVWFDFSSTATNALFAFTGSRIRYVDSGGGLTDQLIGDSDATLRDAYALSADLLATSQDLIVTATLASDGSDTVVGGDGKDVIFGGGSDGLGTDPDHDTLFGDFDPNVAFNGPRPSGQDIMIGDGGRVEMFGRRIARAASESGAEDGRDLMSGNDAGDFMFGGGYSDEMHGFQAGGGNQPLDGVEDNDVMLGDHGEILFDETEIANRVELVRTTYAGVGDTGRSDQMFGTFGNDVMFGGLNGSSDVLEGGLGQDILLGDQGEIRFDLDGDLDTLDLIRSYRDGLGGADIVSGGEDGDVLIGGTAGDEMYGDNAGATSGVADGDDIMLGDNADIWLIGTVGRLTVRVAAMPVGTAVDLITTTDSIDLGDPDFDTKAEVDAVGGPDTMSGNAGADIVIGGVNAGLPDVLYGDRASPTPASIDLDADDILLGDNALLDFTFDTDTDRDTLDLIRSFEDGLGDGDILSGNKGADVAIGGTGDDEIHGDDAAASAAAADGSDALLGDNADVFLVSAVGASGADLRLVLGAAVMTIRTTDEEHPEYGGVDTISGNADGDIIAGGVQGDLLYGDAAAPVDGLDGNDVMLGDNAALEWLSNGRFDEIFGIDIEANNPALWAQYEAAAFDTDLGTLDLITTEQPTNGARDVMYGNAADDLMFGGTDVDEMHGSAGADVMFGDHARVYPQFSFVQVGTSLVESPDFSSRNYFAIDTRAIDGGQGDRMWGDAGDDVMLGQQGDDRMWGGDDDDDMIGGHNVSGTYAALVQATGGIAIDELDGVIAAELQSPDNAMNDAMDGGAGDDAMTGDNAIVWRRGDDLSPRFRLLTAESIYTTDAETITVNIGATPQSDPEDADGRDIQLVDHADDTVAGLFGWDVMAGGADNDVMYGQLGDDLMQGDGSIALLPAPVAVPPWVVRQIDVTDSAGPTGETLYFNVPEATTDGDDYMEGNGGRDLMYGGLGQDDMIGGSSALFGLNGDLLLGLTPEQMRPDDSDTMFGGAGIDIARNHIGDADEDGATHVITTVATGHARDADFMMGDNANVYRLVSSNVASDAFLTFNYDNYAGDLRIVPRAMEQLDYTLGGSDYAGGVYTVDGQATPPGQPADNGAADLIHGESGDDVIFGMTGSDVLFGDGQDDDIVGGYGNDWISGGTGQDGVLGDDGLILTSRNSTLGEPLNGIAALLASDADTRYSNGNALDELIATPGSLQTAVINKSGELKKTIDLVPFSYDPGWIARDDEFADDASNVPFADDIIFGGLGSDWLHGGSGDDAISGAEALVEAYVPVYDLAGNAVGIYDLGYSAVGIANALVVNPTNRNPGNVLAFNPDDVDGVHLNNRFRAGEFRLYDEFDPRRKILLTGLGELDKTGGGVEWLLNFDKSEGVVRPAGTVPKATGQQTENYPQVNDDGGDAIFGDLGNDWIVGGTGRDNLYGGWGNDYLQADDNLETDSVPSGPHAGTDWPNDNEAPDTHPTYEDRAYGGAGRDILIGNTGGDRLIDWVGEYNSYLVPYAPFGQASVSRTLQPFLPEFLYALSAGDGADPTRYRDAIGANPPAPTNNSPNPSRNGEPHGELGLVLQKDFSWGDQTGAPADPQAGNIPGGPRDVLRSADFAGNNANAFVAASGTWKVTSNAYEVGPDASSGNTDAISLFAADVAVPGYFELTASINAIKAVAGFKANAYIVFDYFGPDDFKFAGINVSTNKIEIGQRASWGFQVLASENMQLKAGTDYNVLVAINGSAVTMVVNNQKSVSYAFAPRVDHDGFTYGINAGMFGLGADNGRARIDNVVVQRIPPKVTLTATDEFSGSASTLLTPYGSGWSVANGRFVGTPPAGAAFVVAGNDIAVGVSALLKLDAVLATTAVGGVVFDLYSPTDFKWAAISKATNQVMVGHYTAKSGWVVDMAVSRTLLAGDNTLSVSLKDTTVSVSVNGQQVLSRLYNGTVVDGAVGTFARGGTTSFDSFTLQTDDARFAPPPAQLNAAVAFIGQPASADDAPTSADVAAALAEAKRRWAATGLDAAALAALDAVTVQVTDLYGQALGEGVGNTILIDADAAGHGWFIDRTPWDDREYRAQDGSVLIATHGPAAGKIDLLSVIAHELGHIAGLDHGDAGVMDATLSTGERTLAPSQHDAGLSAAAPKTEGGPSMQAVAIDWGTAQGAQTRSNGFDKVTARTDAVDWRQRFVNHLGASKASVDPNAALRLHIPLMSQVVPRVSAA